MNCPKCKSAMQIEDTRQHGNFTRRKRICKCGHSARSIEVFGDAPTTVDGWRKDRQERDRAIGAIGVLVYDGVISAGRMRELLDMDIYQQREEMQRILYEAVTPS